MGYYRAGGDYSAAQLASHRVATSSSNATPPSDEGGRRYRRMNPTNVRALRRAIRRAKAFEHLARSVVNLHVGKKFKMHRRKRR